MVVGFSPSASGVSADGTVVTGSGTNGGEGQAYRWTSCGGMVGLGYLTAVRSSSSGTAISADGNVIVGSSESDNGNNVVVGGSSVPEESEELGGLEAFRWTSAGGMVGLGDLPGGAFASFASGVSGDGTVAIGVGSTDAGREAFAGGVAAGHSRRRPRLAASDDGKFHALTAGSLVATLKYRFAIDMGSLRSE